MQINNKTFVVTGAGSGMGREITLQLLKKGARVAGTDINANTLEETRKLAGSHADRMSLHVFDVSNEESVKALPNEVIQAHGVVDGLINNAGIIQPFVNVSDLTDEIISTIFDINFYGPLHMIRAFLPHLTQRPEAHILNVSSMGGFIPFPGQTIYSASKAALKLLSEGLYAELKNTPVGVTVAFPGAVNTNIADNSGIKIEGQDEATATTKMLEANRAASIMIQAIEKNKFRVLVGSDARMLDILYRLNPKRAVNLIVKKMSGMAKGK